MKRQICFYNILFDLDSWGNDKVNKSHEEIVSFAGLETANGEKYIILYVYQFISPIFNHFVTPFSSYRNFFQVICKQVRDIKATSREIRSVRRPQDVINNITRCV